MTSSGSATSENAVKPRMSENTMVSCFRAVAIAKVLWPVVIALTTWGAR